MFRVKLPTLKRCRVVHSRDPELANVKRELAETKAQLAEARDVIDSLRRKIAEHFKSGGAAT